MAVFALWCFILLAAALPDLCPRVMSLPAHLPDPWVVLVAYLALRGRGFTAVGWAIGLGLLRDASSLDPLGTHAFVLGAVAFTFCEGRRHRPPVDGVPRLLVTFLAALLAGWLYLVRILPLGGGAVSAADFLHVVPTAFFTAFLAAAVVPAFDHFRLFDDLVGRGRGVPA